jgi:hypothetical protein
MLETAGLECPYCGEFFETTADTSGGDQDYIEDCPVCCRPIELHLVAGTDGELLALTPRREDDA